VGGAALRPGAARTLLLDLDGTLAPIAPTPESARVPPPTLAALRRLIDHGWSVAVVSGRPADQVRRMVPLEGVHVFGSHGLEGCWPGGEAPEPGGLTRRFELLADAAEELAAEMQGARVEHKPTGLAFHDRQVGETQLEEWRGRLDAWLAEQDLTGLERLDGRRVVELRPEGAHKGLVVRRMPENKGALASDDSLIALGDDRTDEDMFRELGQRGLTVRVCRTSEPSIAEVRLPSPYSVQRFLALLADRA